MNRRVPSVVVVGSVNRDLVLEVPALPAPGETVLAARGIWAPGGKGANQAVAAAGEGVPVALLGAVGGGTDGDDLVLGLSRAGVETSAMVRVPGMSGLAVVLVDREGENVIVVNPAANGRLVPDMLHPHLSRLQQAGVVVLQGELSPATVTWVLEHARAAGVPTVLNLAPVLPLGRDVLEMVDVLVMNEREGAQVLVQLGAGQARAPFGTAPALARLLPCTVVVTHGAHGAVVAKGPGWQLVPGVPVDHVVDTTGAGDAFVGAMAAGLARGLCLEDAVRRGNAAGARAVGRSGAREVVDTTGQSGRGTAVAI